MEELNAFSQLIDQLNNPDENIRFIAAVKLGEFGDERAAKPLISHLLNDASAKVRKAIPFALHRIQADGAISPLMQTIRQDKDAIVRCNSVNELGWFACMSHAGRQAYDEIVNLIIEALNHDLDQRVRKSAVVILGVIYVKGPLKNETIIDEIIGVFSKKEDYSVKRSAITSLGWTQANHAIIHLQHLQSDPDVKISQGATRILNRMNQPDWPPIDLTRAIKKSRKTPP
jgi:HEAT repeat protein